MAGAAGRTGLTIAEMERYSRQIVLPQVGPGGQLRLKGSSALVVGIGGLGTPVSVYLAAAGVGKIGIVDDDKIEKSNLQRQTMFSERDIGKKKVKVAEERLREVNPNVAIVPYEERLGSSTALQILKGYDVVVDCTDNLPTRYLINDACVLLGNPDVYASVQRSNGQASVFATASGPCYRCLFPEPPPPETVQDCATSGVLGVLPGLMGSVQAVQALNILLGNGRSLAGRLILFDAAEMTFNELRIKKDPACPACGRNPSIGKLIDYDEFCGVKGAPMNLGEITPRQLKSMLSRGEKVALLDVREQNEHDYCRIEGSTLIPLGRLELRLPELDRGIPIVVYCHVGIRSARATELLRSRGYVAQNLRGGISAWAEQVDPAMPRY